MKKSIRRLLFVVVDILLVIFVFLGIYTVAEYRPAPIESVTFVSTNEISLNKEILQEKIAQKKPISLITWNIGYASLSSDQDFFMDGGEDVRPENKSIVDANLEGILDVVQQNPADFWLFQEIDEDSKRSYNINQREYLQNETKMGSAFAYNFECFYVPFPIPSIGKVMAGLGTYSIHELQNPQRVSLPSSFSWPVRTANMKRCLLVTRVPLGDGEKELVIINAHLEAYDSGEGKIAQTNMLMGLLVAEYEKGNFVIAGGDFNQTFPGFLHEQNEAFWAPGKMENSDLPSGDWNFAADLNMPTARSLHAPFDTSKKDSWQYYLVDGFITSPNIQIEHVETLDLGFKYSDHNPVRLDVILEN